MDYKWEAGAGMKGVKERDEWRVGITIEIWEIGKSERGSFCTCSLI